jgi:membrane protease YdiL (CAAX protease family)
MDRRDARAVSSAEVSAPGATAQRFGVCSQCAQRDARRTSSVTMSKSKSAGPFFALALGITWTLQLPAVLAKHGVIAGPAERFLPLMGLGALGPMLAAIILSAREGGRAEVRALFRPLARYDVKARWYAVALLLPGSLLVLALATYTLVTGRSAGPWLYPPIEPERIAAMVMFPLGEEIGWRGYAQPRLLERRGALATSGIIGVFWGLWHVMMFDVSGVSPGAMLESLPMFLAGSVLFSWLWARTGGSLLLAVLLHVGTHLNNSARALPANPIPATAHTIAYVLFALALIALDRRTFGGHTER